MVSITLEGLCMVSDRIVNFSIFHQISPVRTCNNFQFFNYHGTCEFCIKNVAKQAKIDQDLIKMVSITLEGLWMVSDRIVNFQFFIKFHRSGSAKIFSFGTITSILLWIKKALNQAKIYHDLIKMVSITLE